MARARTSGGRYQASACTQGQGLLEELRPDQGGLLCHLAHVRDQDRGKTREGGLPAQAKVQPGLVRGRGRGWSGQGRPGEGKGLWTGPRPKGFCLLWQKPSLLTAF